VLLNSPTGIYSGPFHLNHRCSLVDNFLETRTQRAMHRHRAADCLLRWIIKDLVRYRQNRVRGMTDLPNRWLHATTNSIPEIHKSGKS
jgi:hypothetical protein